VVVGGTGSGKTTLAAAISNGLGHEHVELDGLWWERGWVHVSAEELAHRVEVRLAGVDRWVVDGNYVDEVATVLWANADTLVWLDLPRPTCFRRAVLRTVRRIATCETLWNGNRQNVGVLSPRSLVALWRLWPSYSARIAALDEGEHEHLRVVRLRSPAEVRSWQEDALSLSSGVQT
jgi:hypothetical protein